MKNDTNIAQTLVRVTQVKQTSNGTTSSRGRVFVTLLFAVLALFMLIALLVSTNTYRAVNNVRSSSDETRLGLSLITNSIRMNDATDAVGVANGPEGLALVLTEQLDSGN